MADDLANEHLDGLPPSLLDHIRRLDAFISTQIRHLEAASDNVRFFDHRREHARTDWDHGGLPRPEWEALLSIAARAADDAGFWRFALPRAWGGEQPDTATERDAARLADPTGPQAAGNLWMAVMREHLATQGLGLHNDLQTEHSVVGNFPDVALVLQFGAEAQKRELVPARLEGRGGFTFGLSEPEHGSDATHMETRAVRGMRGGVEGWVIDGRKKWQTGMHRATHCLVFARTDGRAGDAMGITCFVVPRDAEGINVESYEWTLNMPTDHATVAFTSVFAPSSSILGPPHRGLQIAQAFVHENRLRQAASSLGAATYCIRRSVAQALARAPFGRSLAANQAVQFPLVELHSAATALRLLVRDTARRLDALPHAGGDVEREVGPRVSMCNYLANRLCTEAADRAIQVFGGQGYSRHEPFEHIWRHHRRYRITEGAEEIQMRKVAGGLFGFGRAPRKGEEKSVEEIENVEGFGKDKESREKARL